MRKIILVVVGVLAVVAISAGSTIATISAAPQLLPQGPQGERGPRGAQGTQGIRGEPGQDAAAAVDAGAAVDSADDSASAGEPHLYISGRDLGTLNAAERYCESVQLDIANGGPYPSTGGSIDYPNGNENRANCGYSNGDLERFLDDRKARGDYEDFVH